MVGRSLDTRDLIRMTPFFGELDPVLAAEAAAQVVTRRHSANQTILLENDWGSSVYFVLEGWAKIRTYNVNGKEITLNILGRGEMFGEMAPLEEIPRSTDVISLTPTVIGSLPAPHFVKLIRTEPSAALYIAKLIAKRLRQVNRRLRLRESDSQSRVADILLFLAEGQGKVTSEGIEIPRLPHKELGGLSGLARETVTRALSKLEKKGIIQRDHNILKIIDIEALEQLLV